MVIYKHFARPYTSQLENTLGYKVNYNWTILNYRDQFPSRLCGPIP